MSGSIENHIDMAIADAAIKAALLRGLRLGGEQILGVAVARVPFEEGALANTGATSDNGKDTVAVSFKDADYSGQAADQHENLNLKHDSGRQAKFLESARNDEGPRVSQIMQAEARKAT